MQPPAVAVIMLTALRTVVLLDLLNAPLPLLAASVSQTGAGAGNNRAISWWAEPLTGADADGLVAFAKKHRTIVTTVILECGVVTCCRTGTGECGNEKNSSLPGYRYTCTNNGGMGGVLSGSLSAACAQAIPRLTQLGVRTELWLGEDDSLSSARYMCSHPNETAASMIALARAHPGIVGFNIDFEERAPAVATQRDLAAFASFLTSVTDALNHADSVGPLRMSADVGCSSRPWVSGGGNLDTGCTQLAKSSVNRLMNMRTCEPPHASPPYTAPDGPVTWSSCTALLTIARTVLLPAQITAPIIRHGTANSCAPPSRRSRSQSSEPGSDAGSTTAPMAHGI